MKYQYQKKPYYFAQVAHGLEELASQELKELGAGKIQQRFRGLYFEADPLSLYRINYASRLLTRVLAPLLTFDCHSTNYLYKTALEIPWEELFPVDKSFAIFAQVNNSKISHSKYASLKLKDAIVDRFRDKTGRRPNVNPKQPYIWFNLHIENNRAVISIDTSGSSLHKRGYRLDSVEAPMQETLAAALVLLSGWDKKSEFIDPMCGSGTIAAEAHSIMCNIPAGYFRKSFGFERLPDFKKKQWLVLRKEMDACIQIPGKNPITASDVEPSALRVARRNLDHLPGGEGITTRRQDFRSIEALHGATIVTNPPYGIRLGKGEDLASFYKSLGDWLKQQCTNSSAYVYFGERKYLKNIGLRSEWKKELRNGGLDGRLAKFSLY